MIVLFNIMYFGRTNQPTTFERLMENVLLGLSWKICVVYLDDIIGTSRERVERLFLFANFDRRGLISS